MVLHNQILFLRYIFSSKLGTMAQRAHSPSNAPPSIVIMLPGYVKDFICSTSLLFVVSTMFVLGLTLISLVLNSFILNPTLPGSLSDFFNLVLYHSISVQVNKYHQQNQDLLTSPSFSIVFLSFCLLQLFLMCCPSQTYQPYSRHKRWSWTNCDVCIVCPPEDGHVGARNM